MYRQLPYGVRYLIALAVWAGVVGGDLFFRFALVFLIPFVAIRPPSQQKAQLLVDVGEWLFGPVTRFPKAEWRRLLGLRSARGPGCRPKLIQ